MADYSTIQQHQPLRVPQTFDKYGKALVLQLDEIFDDIYKRFGRLRVDDLGKTLKGLILIEDENGNYVSVKTTIDGVVTDIQDEFDNYYTKSETASEISSVMADALGNYYTKSETASAITAAMSDALGNYYTKSETASEISTQMSTALGDYYTKTETASQISSSITNALGDYSTTSQTADAITAAVGDCYGKVSGITIDTNGIDITGSKYVQISSGGSFLVDSTNLRISSYGGYILAGGWMVSSSGLSLQSGTDTLAYGISQYGNKTAFAFNYTDTSGPGPTLQRALLTTDCELIPFGNNKGSIGTSSDKWSKGYFTNLYGNLTGDVTGNAATATTAASCSGNAATATYATSAGGVTWGNVSLKPDTAIRWPNWGEVTGSGAENLGQGTSDFTDGTEVFSSYASDNGFSDSNAKGVVYRRSALHMYNYVKSKASGTWGIDITGNAATATTSSETTDSRLTKILRTLHLVSPGDSTNERTFTLEDGKSFIGTIASGNVTIFRTGTTLYDSGLPSGFSVALSGDTVTITRSATTVFVVNGIVIG